MEKDKNSIRVMVFCLAIVFLFAAAGVKQAGAIIYSADLVAYYPFNGNANDESGNGHNGIVTRGVLSYDQGVFGTAASFDKTIVSLGKTLAEMGLTDQITLSLWFYDEGSGNHFRLYSDHGGRNNTPNYPTFQNHGAASSTGFTVYAGGNPGLGHSGTITSFEENTWHFLTVIYDGSIAVVYKNGEELERFDASGNLGAGNFGFGAAPDNNINDYYLFKGLIDDVRIYDRALSDDEIRALYCATVTELYTVADAGLWSENPNGNSGDGPSFGVIEAWKINRGVISWEIPSCLLGSTVNSADLKLYVRYLNNPIQVPDTKLNIYQISQQWSENEVTWNSPWTLPGNGEDLDDLFPVSGDFVTMPFTGESPTEENTIHIDVTALVQNWADGDPINGFMVVSGNPSSNYFFTKEASGADGLTGAAVLAIDFTQAPPPPNQLPIANAGMDQTASAGSDCQAWITLDGSESSDPDGDTLTYTWRDAEAILIASVMNPDVLLGVGLHEITLTVTDGEETVSDSVVVTVNDTTAPELSGVPANVGAECDSVREAALVMATDNCQDVVTIFEEVRTAGSFLNDYTLTRTWTATDVPGGNSNSETQIITVRDTIEPTIQSNAPTTIKPPDAPISFTATATDNCGASTVEITVYDCYKLTKKGKRIDKTGSCVVEVNGDTITILDSGGVGDHITWDVTATDDGGNTATETFEVLVVNPGKGKGKK